MADCLNTAAASISSFNIRDHSAIYNAIQDTIGTPAADADLIARAPIPQVELDPEIAEVVAGKLRQGQYNPPSAPSASFQQPSLEGVTYEAANSLISFLHSSPVLSDIEYIEGLDQIPLPDVTPSAPPTNYPQAGSLTGPAAPSDLTTEAPVFELGEKPELVSVKTEDFVPSGIEPVDLSDMTPTYEPPDLNPLDWQEELKYEGDVAFRTKLIELAGGRDEIERWIAPEVQRRIQQSEIRELKVRTKAELDRIMEDTAGKGFPLPTGPAEREVQRSAYRELEDAYKAANRVRDEVFEAAMNTLTRAVQQAIAVERYHFGLYVRYVRQNLRVYQLNLTLAETAYRAMLEIYGRIEQVLNTKIDAYNQYLQAVTSENQAIVSMIAVDQARLDKYRAEVDMFEADVRLTSASASVRRDDVRQQALAVDVYQSELREAQANMSIIETNLDAFREAIRAYRQQGQWYDDAMGAYATSIEATASKTSVDNAKFDAYRRLWSAERNRAGAYREYVQATTSAMDAEMRTYREATGAQRRYLQEVTQALGTSLQAISTYTGLQDEFSRHASGYNTADISYTSAINDVAVSKSAILMASEAIVAEAAAHEARLDASWEAANVTSAGAMAQAASAIYQVGLSASGVASDRVSGRESASTRDSLQERKSFSKVCTYVERPLTT